MSRRSDPLYAGGLIKLGEDHRSSRPAPQLIGAAACAASALHDRLQGGAARFAKPACSIKCQVGLAFMERGENR
jgi:hypothetical protein